MNQPPLSFWGISATEMLQQLHTAQDGLTDDEVKQRLARYGSNLLTPPKRSDLFTLVLAQFKSPITLILLCATGLSFGLRDPVDAFMFSMAGASLVLPFLPLLPKQVLLTNLMTDCPEMTIATDRVDPEMVAYPRRWDIKAIRKFMITFGLVSSVFDYLTFGVLMFVLQATPDQFRTG